MVALGTFVLHSFVKPPVTAGRYQLHGTQPMAGITVGEHVADVVVSSPRYMMPPDQILSTFPPAMAEGDFGTRLPQIALKRRTLPWERDPGGPGARRRRPAPPVARAGRDRRGRRRPVADPAPVAECVTPGTVLPHPEDADSPTGYYLTVTETVVNKVFPTVEDLPLLVHVREVDLRDTELANGDDDGWLAVVLANRLPIAVPTTDPAQRAAGVGARPLPGLPAQPGGPGRRAADRRRPRHRRHLPPRRRRPGPQPGGDDRGEHRPRRHGHRAPGRLRGRAARGRGRRRRGGDRPRHLRRRRGAATPGDNAAVADVGQPCGLAVRQGDDVPGRRRRRRGAQGDGGRLGRRGLAVRAGEDVPLPGAGPLVVHRHQRRRLPLDRPGARRRTPRHRVRHGALGRPERHGPDREGRARPPPRPERAPAAGSSRAGRDRPRRAAADIPAGRGRHRLVPGPVRSAAHRPRPGRQPAGPRQRPAAHAHPRRPRGRQPGGGVRDRPAARPLAAGAGRRARPLAERAVRRRAGRTRSATSSPRRRRSRRMPPALVRTSAGSSACRS